MKEMDKIVSIKEAVKEKNPKKILSDNHKKKLATNLKLIISSTTTEFMILLIEMLQNEV